MVAAEEVFAFHKSFAVIYTKLVLESISINNVQVVIKRNANIPVGIKGAEKPFKKAIITYGKPLDFSEYKKIKKEKETIDKVTEEIMESIIKLTK